MPDGPRIPTNSPHSPAARSDPRPGAHDRRSTRRPRARSNNVSPLNGQMRGVLIGAGEPSRAAFCSRIERSSSRSSQPAGKLSGLRSELTATALQGVNPADAQRLLSQLELIKENVRNAIQNATGDQPRKEQRYG